MTVSPAAHFAALLFEHDAQQLARDRGAEHPESWEPVLRTSRPLGPTLRMPRWKSRRPGSSGSGAVARAWRCGRATADRPNLARAGCTS